MKHAQVYLVDHGHALLAPFSAEGHDYAARTLQRKGVQLRLGMGVKEVAPDRVLLSDGTSIQTRTVVWAGGLMASPLAAHAGLPQGHGGRIDVQPDLTVEGFPGVYALGDFANIPGADGQPLPQLAFGRAAMRRVDREQYPGRDRGRRPGPPSIITTRASWP